MRRTVVHLACALALLGAACGHGVAPQRATSPDGCQGQVPEPGACSPLRHPV
jgi:hypothetical protein